MNPNDVAGLTSGCDMEARYTTTTPLPYEHALAFGLSKAPAREVDARTWLAAGLAGMT